MDLIEKLDMFSEGKTQYNSLSDDELLKTFRDAPDKELKKRNLHKQLKK